MPPIGRITYTCKACGKTFIEEHRCRSYKRVEEWEAWAKGYFTMCNDCRESQWHLKITLQNQRAAKHAKEQNLFPLYGTAKQVAWANTIREKILKEAQESQQFLFSAFDELKDFDFIGPDLKAVLEDTKLVFDKIFFHLKNQTLASNWIEDRRRDGLSFIYAACKNLAAIRRYRMTLAEFYAWYFLLSLIKQEQTLEDAKENFTLKNKDLALDFKDLFENPHVRTRKIKYYAYF